MLTMTLSAELGPPHTRVGVVSHGYQTREGPLEGRLPVGTIRRLAPREHVCHEGDPQLYFYTVETGAVCIYKAMVDGRRQIIDFAYPGDAIGLGAFPRHVFSALAIGPTRVKCIPTGSLYQIAKRDPQLGLKLYEAVSRELLAARDLLLTVGQRNATERVAAFLLALSRRSGRNGRGVDAIVLPMTRADIADFLNLTIETVSRTFTKLRIQGLIDLPQSTRVRIWDIEALEKIAEGGTGRDA
jgi:CRP/FNR family transcriptional regulator